MKWLSHCLKGLALSLLLAGSALAQQTIGPPNAVLCNKTATASAAAATTKIVTEVTGQGVHICGWDVGAGAAVGGFNFISGTGATCGTGTVTITVAQTLAINTMVVRDTPYAQFSTAAGQAICVVTTGTGPTSVTIYFAQF